MRLGGPIFAKTDTPESWAEAVATAGYKAAYCPVGPEADSDTVHAYAAAARKADIVIAEVGAWSNPLSPDPATSTAAMEKCKAALQGYNVHFVRKRSIDAVDDVPNELDFLHIDCLGVDGG